jgi:hypothetical protein
MSNSHSYNAADSFANLDRQDRREEKTKSLFNEIFPKYEPSLKISKLKPTPKTPATQILKDKGKTPLRDSNDFNDIEMLPENPQSIPTPNLLNQFTDTIGKFDTLPNFLKSHLLKLAKKIAILKCKLQQLNEKQKVLSEHKEENTIPPHMIHQKKLINKFSNPATIHKLIHDFIDAEFTKNQEKIEDLDDSYSQRYDNLSELLQPINQQSKLLENTSLDFHIIIDTLIEREFCTMLLKQQEDKLRKRLKKEKHELTKAKNDEIVTLTVKDLNKLKKDIKHAKKTTISSTKKQSQSKPKVTPKSKNSKGKNDQKKSSLPKPKGKTSNDSKKGGKSKNSNVTRQ